MTEMQKRFNLTGQILIAMPAMQDRYFAKSVILICNHDEDGAMGIILNHPLQMQAEELFEQLSIDSAFPHQNQRPIYFGGPVQVERGFVLHHPATEFNTTMEMSHALGLTSSKDILEAAASDSAPAQMLIALGYAGWTAGQLETEIQENAWLNLDITDQDIMHKVLFEIANEDKHAWSMRQLGLDYANLSEVSGHA